MFKGYFAGLVLLHENLVDLDRRRARGQPQDEGVLGCWVRRTLMTNRAVVVIAAPNSVDPALFAREHGADLLPGRRRGGRRRIGKAHLDRGAHLYVETLVRLVDAIDVDVVAEMVEMLDRQCRHGGGLDADRGDLLSGERACAQMGDVMRRVDTAGVGVGRTMREQVLHG